MTFFRNRRCSGYDGSGTTSRLVCELVPGVMNKITQAVEERPDLVLAAWPEIIGAQLAPMTEVVSFSQGVLSVKVKNATLYSLLSQREKGRILAHLKKRFPKTTFVAVNFRMG